ncbi:Uncharacterised protein [Serratia proteamaculans]|nr:Uncharacterised protein [Serratia quinivorans]CAI1219260.1 Uncharacterised protein [Serratia quinivorans]CAI2036898.1 Uncharacterised protein [Serratia proteamaculans]CAI2531588.1 Uncharacterised protein [Serratia proteamaculans]
MADIALQYVLLMDFLTFVLLCPVIVIRMDHGAAAIMS